MNRVLWKSTAAEHYATLFVGVYDDAMRRLTYVNCGHNPPMLLRADGSVERLEATATVIGMFETWECAAREIQLGPGDLLAISSDGVTEAMLGEEEFGEPRLLDELRSTRRLPLEQIVTAVFNAVQQFSAGNQSDDLTLVVARAKCIFVFPRRAWTKQELGVLKWRSCMTDRMMRLFAAAVLVSSAALAQPAPMRQFLFRLEPVRADFTLQNMTDAERPVVAEHAAHLKTLLDQGTLIMAGQAFDPKGFWGIVIVNATDPEAATTLMNQDPAIKSKMFRGVVVPFQIVFASAPGAAEQP